MKKSLIIESSNISYCTLSVVCAVILALLKLTCYNCTFTSKHKKCMYVMFVCMLNWPFPRVQLAILRSLWRLGRCLVELHHGTVLLDEFRPSFLFALVTQPIRRDSVNKTVPECNCTQHRPSHPPQLRIANKNCMGQCWERRLAGLYSCNMASQDWLAKRSTKTNNNGS